MATDSVYTQDEASYLAVEMTVSFVEALAEICMQNSSSESLYEILHGSLQGLPFSKIASNSLAASDIDRREEIDEHLTGVIKKELLRVNQTLENQRNTVLPAQSVDIWAEENAQKCLHEIIEESGYLNTYRTLSECDMYVVLFSPDSLLKTIREAVYYLLSDYYHPQEKHAV